MVCDQLDRVFMEIKRTERPAWKEYQRQAIKDAGDLIPVIAHRYNGCPWQVMVPLDRLMEFVATINEAMDRRAMDGDPADRESGQPGVR